MTNGEGRGSAREAGLRYTTDADPGFRRRRSGRGFRFEHPDGTRVEDAATLRRIRGLAIPPAWTDVWISVDPRGHLQAVGRDARGRKQYRYHPDFRSARESDKFARLIEFGESLPRIRERVAEDLGRPGLPRDKVLALVVRLLETTLIRVGNEEYARLNRSFGLTTLRDRHARIEGSRVRFRFRGKSGRTHEVGLRDRRLAALVRRCQELPGQELFQYVDEDGEHRAISSEDVNEYLRSAAGLDITAKMFRTWAATVLAVRALRRGATPATERAARREVVSAMREIADRLGNTPTVARQSYVHPAVVDAYLSGSIGAALVEAASERPEPPPGPAPEEEADTLALLREGLARHRATPARRERSRAGARAGVSPRARRGVASGRVRGTCKEGRTAAGAGDPTAR